MNTHERIQENKKNSLINEDQQRTHLKSPILSKTNKQKEMLQKQLKLVRNKEVRAVPDGYYTGLINDMHKDYLNYTEKGRFLQMDYLTQLLHQTKQTSKLIDRFNEETRLEERKLEKLKSPITLHASSIQCTLPSNYQQLQNLSPLSFLTQYSKPSVNRQQIILKLIRKISRDLIIEMDDVRDIIFEYFNHYKTHQDIDELFHFLDIHLMNSFQLNEIVIICCYAERYFLHKLAKTERIVFERPLQEIIDFEFLKRKLNGLILTDSLKRLINTLEGPSANNHFSID